MNDVGPCELNHCGRSRDTASYVVPVLAFALVISSAVRRLALRGAGVAPVPDVLLVGVQPSRLARGHQVVARRQVLEDVGRLRDHQRARLQEWRPERRQPLAAAAHPSRDRAGAVDAADIDIRSAGVLEGEPDKLAPPLDARPVIELVRHAGKITLNSR